MSDHIIEPTLISSEDKQKCNITSHVNQNEMLRIATDGFYVKGKKLDIDETEALSVYKALREFLIFSALLR